MIIPRHIQYFENLNEKVISENLKKITIHNKFGDSMSIFERSKIVFMGGSLIEHGGQNPLEPLSHGCFVLSGSFNKNFEEIYLDLEKLNLCKTMNSDNLELISNEINNKKKLLEEEINSEIVSMEKEINELKKRSPETINQIAVSTSSDLLKQIIGADVNKSNISAIVEDLSKKEKERYYGV